jgi:hypothetical protein
MRMEGIDNNKGSQQIDFDFGQNLEDIDSRSEQEKMNDLRARIVREGLANFSFDSLKPEEKMLYRKLQAEDTEGDQPKFRSH